MHYQNLQEYELPEDFRGRSPYLVQLWWLVQAILINPSPQFMYGWRRFLLRLFGAKIGSNVIIRPSVKVTYPWKLTVGNYSWIGDEVVLYTLGEIVIGENSVISQRSYLCTGSHNYTKRTFDIYAKKITIGNEVWISADVFIAPGVSIGDGAVIGARSTVLEDMPGGMVCYGSPARAIKPRVMSE